MIDLPVRAKLVDCPIADSQGVVFLLEPLSDAELMDVLKTDGVVAARDAKDGDGTTRVAVSLPLMLAIFPAKVRGAQELTIAGEEFDAKNPDHVAAVSFTWKMEAVGHVVAYASQLPKELVGNSKRPVALSPTDTT